MADPFEEFEFKPLTEGLGFHKKAAGIKAEIKSANLGGEQITRSMNTTPAATSLLNSNLNSNSTPAREPAKTASQSISELMASLPPSLDFLDEKATSTPISATTVTTTKTQPTTTTIDRPQIFQPLAPREDYKSPLGTGPTVGNVLPAPGTKAGSVLAASFAMAPTSATIAAPIAAPYRDRMNEGFSKTFPHAERAIAKKAEAAAGLSPVAANFAAGLIDAMIVAGVSTILLVCIITITKINLIALLSNASTDGSTQLNLVFLFAAVLQMYMLISRAFFGSSLGEWAFELQMGTAEQQRKLVYPVQVLWRTLITTVTGVVVLPLLSFALNRDLGKYITGLQLYRRL